MSEPILRVENLKTYFPVKGGILSHVIGHVRAVDDVTLDIQPGESMGLVGESGCGKSTIGRTIMGLYPPTEGKIVFRGKNVAGLPFNEMKVVRREMQMVFQDPFSSLDPRMTVERIVTEPYRLHEIGNPSTHEKMARELLARVGLKTTDLKKYPHEFSGGQRQRIGIARALALKPKFIIADEPVAALDVSIQAQVLNLLNELKRDFNLTYLFISHDLAIVKYFSDRVAVMYLGKIVELTTSIRIYREPLHPYTRALMSAITTVDPTQKRHREILPGDVPSPLNPPPGCTFHPRCKYATDICRIQVPQLRTFENNEAPHLIRCHWAEKIREQNPRRNP